MVSFAHRRRKRRPVARLLLALGLCGAAACSRKVELANEQSSNFVPSNTAPLADSGIPMGSQTVLLKGVNDNVETMKQLFHNLLKARVRPYYLYQCDPISGSTHFRTPVEKGLEIMQGLRGHTTGYASPAYVIDAPGGGGKIPLLPEYAVGRRGDYIVLRNYEGREYLYPDPVTDKTADEPVTVSVIAGRE